MLELWNMRKFLAIIVLSLLCSNKGFAELGCNDYIDFDWYWINNFGKQVSKSEAHRANMVFKNTGNKGIIITEIHLKTKNKDIVVKEPRKTYLQSYGKIETAIWDLNKYNLDVVGWGGYRCKFGSKPVKKSSQTLDEILKQKNKKSGAQKWLDKIRGN